MRQLLLYGLFAAAGICRAGVILSISPTSQTVLLGSSASFAVNVSGLGNGTALGTYDINIGFDPVLLNYESIAFGNQVDISGLGDIQTLISGLGSVEVFELSLDPASELVSLQASSFTLATLTFGTLSAAPASPVTLSINALGDAYGNSIEANVQNASISITSPNTVPEPRPAWLLALFLPVFVVWRKFPPPARPKI